VIETYLRDLLARIRGAGSIGDGVTSWLRTVVPVLWGVLLVLAVTHVPGLPVLVVTILSSAEVVGLIVAGVTAGWYALWRWLEPRTPAWLTRLVLGSNKTPSYLGEHARA
jgi:hypothetical protein